MIATFAVVCLPLLAPQQPDAPAQVVLSGRVVDLRGEGVPVAEVWLGGPGDRGDAAARTVADAEGYFRLGDVPTGSWTLSATADGRSIGSDYTSGASDIARIEVHDATTLRGVVRDPDGAPVAGVTVAAAPAGRALRRQACTAVTDDEGRFAIAKVALGLTQVSAWVPGHGLAQRRHRVQGDGDVTLQPEPGPTTAFEIAIAGLPDDAPEVTLAWLPYRSGSLTYLPEPYRAPRITGGGWQAAGLPDWDYTIRLRAAGLAFEPDRVRVEAGAGPHRLRFVATPTGTATLRCPASVADGDGEPVAGVSLVLRRSNGGPRATATSDQDGRLVFESPLAAGTEVVVYSVSDGWVVDQAKQGQMSGVDDRRFLEDHECTVDPSQELQLRVVPASTVRGRLLHRDGRPAAFVRVDLQESRSGRWPEWMAFAWATTDRDGGYVFRRLHHSPDPVRVAVEGAAGTAESEPFWLAEVGARVTQPPLALAPPSVVEGVVRDAAGEPVPGIAVWLRDWDFARGGQRSGSVTEVITDRQGRYRFLGVPTGGAWLQLLEDEDGMRARRGTDPFEVEPGRTYEQDLVLQ